MMRAFLSPKIPARSFSSDTTKSGRRNVGHYPFVFWFRTRYRCDPPGTVQLSRSLLSPTKNSLGKCPFFFLAAFLIFVRSSTWLSPNDFWRPKYRADRTQMQPSKFLDCPLPYTYGPIRLNPDRQDGKVRHKCHRRPWSLSQPIDRTRQLFQSFLHMDKHNRIGPSTEQQINLTHRRLLCGAILRVGLWCEEKFVGYDTILVIFYFRSNRTYAMLKATNADRKHTHLEALMAGSQISVTCTPNGAELMLGRQA